MYDPAVSTLCWSISMRALTTPDSLRRSTRSITCQLFVIDDLAMPFLAVYHLDCVPPDCVPPDCVPPDCVPPDRINARTMKNISDHLQRGFVYFRCGAIYKRRILSISCLFLPINRLSSVNAVLTSASNVHLVLYVKISPLPEGSARLPPPSWFRDAP